MTIYLDHHAATPIDPEVRAVIDAARELAWANPSSVHAAGRAARALLERAREELAAAIRAHAADIVFTAGGTEAVNLAVRGLAPGARTIVTTTIEHPALAQALPDGARVIRLDVPEGRPPDLDAFDRALHGAELVAIGWVNHETGTILPVEAYAERCRARGVAFAIDATQALGKIPVSIAIGASALAFGSSKIGGPPGAGAVWIARDASLSPILRGGAQERGRRAGTLDAAAIAGFGAAAARIGARLAAMPDVARRRDRLERALVDLCGGETPPDPPVDRDTSLRCASLGARDRGALVNGGDARVATVSNVSVPGWRGPSLVAALDLEGLCASSGAACSSGLDQPSPVVRAMYPDASWRAESALRLSLGPSTRDADIDEALAILERVLARKSVRMKRN